MRPMVTCLDHIPRSGYCEAGEAEPVDGSYLSSASRVNGSPCRRLRCQSTRLVRLTDKGYLCGRKSIHQPNLPLEPGRLGWDIPVQATGLGHTTE